jgi:hypothetical protein
VAPSGRDSRVLQEHLDDLCAELRTVVGDAERSGNAVVETWSNFGKAVMLQRDRPVLEGASDSLKASLVYRPVNDPHYWRGEIHCRAHPGWFIALPFEGTEHSDLGLELLHEDGRRRSVRGFIRRWVRSG